MISPPGTEGCASSPGGDGLTAFFNAHSHGIPEDFQDGRRLVTFPTRVERKFCSETGIPKLVPIRFRMIRFLQVCSGIERTIRTQQLMISRIAGDSGNSLTQHRLKGNMFSHNHAAFFAPIPRGGGVRRFRGANKHCQFPSTRRFGESWDSASLRYDFPHRKRKGIMRGIWNRKMSVRSRKQSQHVSHIYAYATGRISR